MDKFCIGSSIDGYKSINFKDDEVIKNSLVVIILTDSSNGRLYDYYSFTRQAIVDRNKVIVLLDGERSKIRKQICMLLVSYGIYDIYNIEDMSNITDEYIEKLANRKPSEMEVDMFIGSDITAYSDINNILLKITDCVENMDIERLKAVIEENQDKIEQFTDVIDYMKQVVDKANSGGNEKEVDELNKQIKELQKSLEKSTEKSEQSEENIRNLTNERDTYKKELNLSRRKLADAEEQLNNQDTVIKMYSELQTATLRCRARVILYFKEISHISYISSLVTKYMEWLQQILKLKVKLMIYDNKTSFLYTYKPLPIIGSIEFVKSKEAIVNKHNKLVIVEANQAIMEDTLKADWDVIIVYDRMKQDKDIVVGNNVYKYWVMNSLSEYKALSNSFTIPKNRIITRPGVVPEALTIQEIPAYKTKTDAGKLSTYLSMANLGEDKRRVFDILSGETNVNTLKR